MNTTPYGTAKRTDAHPREPDAVSSVLRGPDLVPRELLMLQLSARAYSSAQIAAFVGQPELLVDLVLQRAVARLGASDVPGAVARALRRGLIVQAAEAASSVWSTNAVRPWKPEPYPCQ